MKIANSWAAITIVLLLTGAQARAQEVLYIPHIDEARTPIELQLQSSELALPGLGIGSTRAAIIKRLKYAQVNNWLSTSQNQQFCDELKLITDKEQSLRDASGKLSYEARAELTKQLDDLNEKFEESVLLREQSNPGIQGLLARQALLVQRVNQAASEGRMTAKQAAVLKAEIKAIAAEVPEKDISDELSRKIASNLNKINRRLDTDLHGSSVATSPLPFPR